MNDNYIVIILLLFNIVFCIIGYILGKISNKGVLNTKPTSFFTKEKDGNKIQSSSINIDEKKFVTEIKTDNLEKKYSNLGEIRETKETINSSVDKLKNLKK